MNKQAISTIIASAALGFLNSARRNFGNKNQDVTINNIYDLRRYANDPQLAPTVTEVYLFNKNLTEIPTEIGNLINLEELWINNNQISQIPKEIGNLINLKTLYLHKNQISQIPKEIGNLINLEILYLHENQIISLPKEIGNLINLEELWINKNQISQIPKEIGNLINLEELTLNDNPLQSPTQEELINLWIPTGFSSKIAELLLPQLPSEQSSIRRF